jgi:hypothetical protein
MSWQDAIVAVLVLTAACFVVVRTYRLFVNKSPSCCSKGCGRSSTLVQIAPNIVHSSRGDAEVDR